MKIKVTDYIRSDTDSFFGQFLLSVFSEESVKELEKTNWNKEQDICLTINGKEFSILDVCKDWDKQLDKMIQTKAEELIKEKIADSENSLYVAIRKCEEKLLKGINQ